jgi:hypothetical protein
MKHTEICPKCGPKTLNRRFNFCPDCGTTVEGMDMSTINNGYTPTRRPAKVDKVLEEMGCRTDVEKNTMLNSIGYTANPTDKQIISGHAGKINNG